MSIFIAIDCGKFNTKVSAYNSETEKVLQFRQRTKICDGTFDDDMFDKGTYITQVDGGNVYKIGNGARIEADLETSKKTEIHRISTLSSIAVTLGAMGVKDEVVDVYVAIGVPLQIANIPEERISYKNFIFGNEDEVHTVKLKTTPDGVAKEIKFKVVKKNVYPEGIGVLYRYPEKINGPTAIIDIGNLNTNHIYADGFNMIPENCFTDELGGKVLISSLAQLLTSTLGMRCDENLATSLLRQPLEKRFLTPKNKDKTIIEKSKKTIDDFLMEHVNTIKSKCDAHHYPLEFMNVIAIGGTALFLDHELKTVFGEDTFIPDDPIYANSAGFLRKMCADHNINVKFPENKEKSK